MSGRVKAIIAREWDDARKNSAILLTSGIVAAVYALLPAIVLLPLRAKIGPGVEIPADTIREGLGQFLAFFFLMPVIIPSTIASYSIIGEKQNRSLEPLLATPISTSELLVGKSLAYLIPSVVTTWLSYTVSLLGVYLVEGPRFLPIIWQPGVITALLLFVPMIAAASMLLIILISARSRDSREAQQWTVLIVIPMMGLGIAVGFGKIPFTTLTIILAATVMAIVNVAALRVVTALFQREHILTRWK